MARAPQLDIQRLYEAIEVLDGRRGNSGSRAVRWEEVMGGNSSLAALLAASTQFRINVTGRPVAWASTIDTAVLTLDEEVTQALEGAVANGLAAAAALAAANAVQINLDNAVLGLLADDDVLESRSSDLEARLNLLGPMNVDAQGLLGLTGWRDGHTEPTNPATVNLTTAATADPERSGLDIIASGYGTAFHEELIPIDPTHTYRVTVRVKREALATDISLAKLSIGLTNRDATGAVNGDGGAKHSFCAAYNVSTGLPLDADYHVFTGLITGIGAGANEFRATTAFVSRVFNLNLNDANTGNVMHMSQFDIEDETNGATLTARTVLTEIALATTDGIVQAMVGIAATTETVDGVVRIASIRLTSAANPDGSGGTAITLNASDIVADGTLSTNALVVGLGRQKLTNTDFSQGASGWAVYAAGTLHGPEIVHGVRAPGSTYAGSHYPTYMIRQIGSATDGFADFYCQPEIVEGTTLTGVPVEAGQWIEVSVKVGLINCEANLLIQWLDETGGHLSWATGLGGAVDTNASATDPESWPVLNSPPVQVPVGAAYAGFRIRKQRTNAGAESYLFLNKPQLAVTSEFATQPIPYSVGGTTLIDGAGIRTNAIVARHITALTVNAGHIAADAINATHIAADEIDATHIAADAIEAEHISVGSINAGNMIVDDLIIRGHVQYGAVSDGVTYTAMAPGYYLHWNSVYLHSLGEFNLTQFWQIASKVSWRSRRKRVTVGSGPDGPFTTTIWTATSVGVRMRTQDNYGGAWSGYIPLNTPTWSGKNSSWLTEEFVVPKQGEYNDVQIDCYVSLADLSAFMDIGSGTASDTWYSNVDDVSLVARALVR